MARYGAGCLHPLLVIVALWASTRLSAASDPASESPHRRRPEPGAQIFDEPRVLRVRLALPEAALERLRNQPRDYVQGTVTVDGTVFTNVAIKLKGAAGSFRPIDDQPAFTVDFNKFVRGQKLFGLDRIHLNNSVQDGTFMQEFLASELYRSFDVPTPRVSHALVELNDRQLGLYVVKEGFTKPFLGLHFRRTDGNLYDGGFLRDIDQALELDSGKGAKDYADLKALDAAARIEDEARRWTALQRVLDVDRFVTYAALSVLLADWDGYLLNRNNYRIYFDPTSGKAVFMPHGMDQLLQRSDMDMFPVWHGQVAYGLLETTEGKRRYVARFRQLYHDTFLEPKISNIVSRVAVALAPHDPNAAWNAKHLTRMVRMRRMTLSDMPELQPDREATSSHH